MFMAGSFYDTIEIAGILMMVGLTSLIFGNGFFKPNISTMVGQLYAPGDKRVDSAFTIFYMGINLGAFFSPLVCGYLGDTGNPGDFKWGFLAACIGMIVSLILFITLKDKYIVTPDGKAIGSAPNSKRETKDIDTIAEAKSGFSSSQIITWLVVEVVLFSLFFYLGQGVIGSFIFSLSIAAPGFIISDKSLTKIESQRIWVIYIVAFFVIFFWAAFEQAGASLTFFAEEQTDRTVFGKEIPASYFQSVNAVAIVIFAAVFVGLWGFLGKRNMEPASPYKQSIGLFLLALGYLVIAYGVKGIDPSTKVSMMWLLGLYLIHTFGELCLSPIGLSMVNKLAPIKFASLLMGVWFLSTSAANKFAGTLSSYYPETMLKVAEVQVQETERNIKLVKDINKAEEINGTKYISIDAVSFEEVKDKETKAEVVTNIFKDHVIKEKKFAGFVIDSLYSFFMLFVVMAGIASIILFILSKRLLVMMNGVV
jgi:POT family proton-dependent oligopeptide transporter